jgi:trehalose 6-phosphate phosphatase
MERTRRMNVEGSFVKIIQPHIDLDRFFMHLRETPRRALLLDYDGTLAPFRVARDQAIPYPGVRTLLTRILQTRQTRLAIISGRAVHDLVPLIGLTESVEMWGSHGWERWTPEGGYQIAGWSARISDGIAAARQWIQENGLGDRCEEKPAGLALHWRGLGADAARAMRERVLEHWAPLAQQAGLSPHPFDGGIELRIPGRHKGHVVKTILTERGAGAAVAYLGDDLTDEDAFTALSGRGLSILVRPELRPTAADLWLQPPEELLAFLRRWHQSCDNTSYILEERI